MRLASLSRSGKDKTLINLVSKKMLERVGTYYYFFPIIFITLSSYKNDIFIYAKQPNWKEKDYELLKN